MWDLVAEYGAKLLVVASPYLVKWLSPQLQLEFASVAPEYREAAASASLLFLLFLIECRSESRERTGRSEFLDDYLDQVLAPWDAQLGTNLRVNLMVARRWPLLAVRTFHWTASRGFGPGVHHDVQLFFTEFQGVCGAAFRAEEIQWYDLRTAPEFTPSVLPWRNPFGLTRGQYKKTRAVKAILSVPLIRRTGPQGNPEFKRVGVLNVDAISDVGADWLEKNRKVVENEMLRAGQVLASVA